MKKRFKVGQTVYYYYETASHMGSIMSGKIEKAIKNLATGEVIYDVTFSSECIGWPWSATRQLTADYLYANKKQIEAEYKDELAYNVLYNEMQDISKTLAEILEKLKDKTEAITWNDLTLGSITADSNSIVISGVGDIRERIDDLDSRLKVVEKKIKTKSKKKVVKPKEEKKDDKEPKKYVLDEGIKETTNGQAN